LRLPHRRGPRARGRLPQLRSAQHAGGAPRARHAGHALPEDAGARRRRRTPGDAAAHAHVRHADPLHGDAPAADPADRAGTCVSARRARPHALADVHAGRGARRRRGDARRLEGLARRLRARAVRRRSRHAVPSELLPLHRAERRARHQLRGLWRDGSGSEGARPAEARKRSGGRRRMWDVQTDRLDRSARKRHGAPRRVRSGRLRLGALHRLRLRRRHRAPGAAQVGDRGHPPVLRERPALPGAVPAMKRVLSWLQELVPVPSAADEVASRLALRGFEVASIEPAAGSRGGHGREAVIDFEITANRPDCLSVIGLAREASAAYSLPLQLPERTMPPAGQPQPIDVTIEDAELCPRYCAQVFEVRSTGASPAWLRERLEAAGVRSISAVVDVTNYVMLEMGQPTHAFDLAKLGGRALRIRRARAGETLRTLDGVDRALEADMLVIADAERPQAIGGVMGGAPSEIGPGTKQMVLESAYFKPASVRRTSKRLGLKTEASSRFERGADVNAAPVAIARAAALLQQIGAAQPLGPMIDRYPSPVPPVTLTLRASRIEHVLGVAVADSEIPARLQPLGFSLEPRSPTSEVRQSEDRTSDVGPRTSAWSVNVPSFRV